MDFFVPKYIFFIFGKSLSPIQKIPADSRLPCGNDVITSLEASPEDLRHTQILIFDIGNFEKIFFLFFFKKSIFSKKNSTLTNSFEKTEKDMALLLLGCFVTICRNVPCDF